MNEAALPQTPAVERVGVRREVVIVIAIALILAAMLASIKSIRVDEMRGDTAIFLQTTENIAASGRPVSEVFANTQAYLDGHYPTKTAAQIAHDPLNPPAQRDRNMLRFHAYLILYPLALLAKFFPTMGVLLAAWALSFAGILAVAYLELRAARVPIAGALLFCALIVATPAWGQGALFGQFYPDRLFVLIGLLFMVVFARRDSSQLAQGAAALACLLTSERGAIIAGLFALLYTALYWRELQGQRRFKCILGASLLVYGMLAIRVLLSDPQYAHFFPSGIGTFMAELRHPAFVQMIVLYVLACLPALVLAFFEWRAGVIAFVLMLPNILGNIGGAEKIGWATHYHSYDLPVLVWASMVGYAAAFNRAADPQKRGALYGLTAMLAMFLVFLNPSSFNPLQFGTGQAANSFFVTFPQQTATYLTPSGRTFQDLAAPLAQAIPPGADVTTPEGGMPFLYRGRTLHLFPIGVDRADYAVMNDYGAAAGAHRYGGTVNFLGPDESRRIDDEIVARMRKDGYDFAHAVTIPGLSLAVVKRRR